MKINQHILMAIAMVITFSNVKTMAQTPDNTFGTNGKVYTSFGNFSSYCHAMTLLPDGRIISAGENGNTTLAILIAKHLPDGNPDISFNGTGKKQLSYGSTYEFCNSVMRQSDDNLVFAGSSNGDAAMARLLPNGDFDATFSADGKVTLSFGAGNGSSFKKVLQQPDGKIIAIGEAYNATGFDFAVVRLNGDGSLDNTFGTGGKTTINFNNFNDFGRDAVLEPGGKIIVAGAAKNSNGNSSIALLRLNADGSPDNSFGTAGKTTLTISGTADDYAESVAVLTNGKIVVGGYAAGDFLVMRYNADGTLDNSFGTNGFTITDFGNFQDKAYSLAIDNSGSIYLGGHGYEPGNGGLFHSAIAKYAGTGLPDNTFDSDGKMTIVMGAEQSTIFDLALQPDGKLLAGGYSTNIAGGYSEFSLLRLENIAVGTGENNPLDIASVIFPNPAVNFIRIISSEAGGSGLLKLYDVTGQIVLQANLHGPADMIDVSRLKPGLYPLTISNNLGTRSYKIIRQ
jgi:uncharacterized delta-60 repeat protein